MYYAVQVFSDWAQSAEQSEKHDQEIWDSDVLHSSSAIMILGSVEATLVIDNDGVAMSI